MKASVNILVCLPLLLEANAPLPTKASLRKLGLHYFGQPKEQEFAKNFFWGLHGNNSRGGYLFELSRFGSVVRADVNYIVKEPPVSRPDHAAFANGQADCMHLDRISPGFAEELRQRWIDDLVSRRRLTRSQAETWSVDDIVSRFPEYALALFDEYPSVNAIVHMVYPTLPDAVSSRATPGSDWLRCRVATCRAQANLIKKAEIRFLPEIKISL